MYDDMISSGKGAWTPPDFAKFGDPTFFTDAVPSHDRNVTAQGWFEHYMIGINGLCSVYDPPVSYWYGNFDILLGPFRAHSRLHPAPRCPCAGVSLCPC